MGLNELLFEEFCSRCPHKNKCHEDCEYCDEVLEKTEKSENEKVY